MKTNKPIRVALIGALIATAGFYSCEKTYVEPNPAAPTAAMTDREMPSASIVGIWRISTFQWHDRTDNTDFVYYTFTFNANGSITAIHHNISEYGKWYLRNNILVMEFNEDRLNELTNKWTVELQTNQTIELKGLSHFDNSSEYLTFSRLRSATAAVHREIDLFNPEQE